MIKITGLFIYPVKSLAGISLRQAEIGARGLKYDREWVIVDYNNRFISQREDARLALIKTNVDENKNLLTLTIPGNADGPEKELCIPLDSPNDNQTIVVTVWKDSAEATVESDYVNAALSEYLGKDLRLVRMAKNYKRHVDHDYAPGEENVVGFADGFPLLIISDESLEDLNSRLEYPVLMNRFRPNLTTCGGGAFGEDSWGKVLVSGVEMDVCKPCERCVVTTVDQESAIKGKEPLRTLANFRKKEGKIMFGQNALVKGSGTLSIDDVLVLATEPTLGFKSLLEGL